SHFLGSGQRVGIRQMGHACLFVFDLENFPEIVGQYEGLVGVRQSPALVAPTPGLAVVSQRKYRPVVGRRVLHNDVARSAIRSSAGLEWTHRLAFAVRSPLSFMRKRVGSFANRSRGSSSDIACSSYSTCKPSRRHSSRNFFPSSDSIARMTSLGEMPWCNAMVDSPACFARSGQSPRDRSLGTRTTPRVRKAGRGSLARPTIAKLPVRHVATPARTNCRRSRQGARWGTGMTLAELSGRAHYRSKVISTTVSGSSPIHASSRTDPTQTSTLPRGTSSVTDPSLPVSANVPPQTNPHPFTMTRRSGRGRPS